MAKGGHTAGRIAGQAKDGFRVREFDFLAPDPEMPGQHTAVHFGGAIGDEEHGPAIHQKEQGLDDVLGRDSQGPRRVFHRRSVAHIAQELRGNVMFPDVPLQVVRAQGHAALSTNTATS